MILWEQDMKIKDFVLNGILMTLVIVSTLILRIPTPTGGHINLGDCPIFIAALCLGGLRGGLIGGIGAAIADFIGGHSLFVVPTLFIKFLEGFVCGWLFKKLENAKYASVCACIAGSIIMAAGYFAFECFAIGIGAALSVVVPNIIQGTVCCIIAFMIFPAIRKKL